MRTLNNIIWLLIVSLMVMGCPEGNDRDKNNRNAGSGTRSSRPKEGVSFTSDSSVYGIDVWAGSTEAYISTRQSGLDRTGFGLKITNNTDGARLSTNSFGIQLVNPNAHYKNNTTSIVRFSSVSSTHLGYTVGSMDVIRVNTCMYGTAAGHCTYNANNIAVLTYSQCRLATPYIYYLPGAPRWTTSEIRNYFNNVVKQAICEFSEIRGGTVIDVPSDVWNLYGDGEFHYPDAFMALRAWLWAHGSIDRNEPTLVVVPTMIVHGNNTLMGVAYENFAVVGLYATLRDMLHEILHLELVAGLGDVVNESHPDNIMYYSGNLFGSGTNLLYRDVATLRKGLQRQWNKLNLGR